MGRAFPPALDTARHVNRVRAIDGQLDLYRIRYNVFQLQPGTVGSLPFRPPGIRLLLARPIDPHCVLLGLEHLANRTILERLGSLGRVSFSLSVLLTHMHLGHGSLDLLKLLVHLFLGRALLG